MQIYSAIWECFVLTDANKLKKSVLFTMDAMFFAYLCMKLVCEKTCNIKI